MSDTAAPAAPTTEAAPQTPEEIAQNIVKPDAAAPKPPEVVPKPETQPDPQEDKFASKFAALSRKEKALRAKEAELEQRMKEAEERSKPKVEPEEPLELRLKKDPMGELKKLGLSYETLTQILLNDGKLTPELQQQLSEQKLKSELGSQVEELRKRLEAKEAAEEKKRQEDEERTNKERIANFKSSIADSIKAKAAEFELLNVEGEDGIELVYNVIAQDAQRRRDAAEEAGEDYDGSILSIEEAAQKVEDYYLEEAKKRVNLNKIKGLFQPPASAPTKAETTTQAKPETKQASITLSNESQQAQSKIPAFLSDDESKREAAKLLKFYE